MLSTRGFISLFNSAVIPTAGPKAAKPDSLFLVWRGETQGVVCLRFIPLGLGNLKPGSRTFTGLSFLPLTASAVLVLLCAPKVVRSCSKEPQCAFPCLILILVSHCRFTYNSSQQGCAKYFVSEGSGSAISKMHSW